MNKKMRLLSAILAAVLCASCMSGCGEKKQTDETEVPKIKYYALGTAMSMQEGSNDVFARLNEMSKEKIGAELEIVAIDAGNYDQQMTVKLAANEPFDLMFTSNWINKFDQLVAKKALMPLNDLLETYAKEYYDSIPQKWWDCASIDGNIYGAINQQIFARQPYVAFKKEFTDKVGFDWQSVKSIGDLDPFFAALKADGVNSEEYQYIGGTEFEFYEEVWGFNKVGDAKSPGDIKIGETENIKVFNQYATEEFKNFVKMMNDWEAKKYFNTKSRAGMSIPASLGITSYGACYKPGYSEIEQKNSFGEGKQDIVCAVIGESVIDTSNIVATMLGITHTSKNPEKTMELINLFQMDKEFFNLMCYGIEGRDYDKIGENKIKICTDAAYRPGIDWAFGNQFNAFVQEGMPDNVWEEQNRANHEATESPLLGFNFDPTSVQTEMANCNAIINEYLGPLVNGQLDAETGISEFLSKLDAAGAQKVIDEKQKQIDAFLAN